MQLVGNFVKKGKRKAGGIGQLGLSLTVKCVNHADYESNGVRETEV